MKLIKAYIVVDPEGRETANIGFTENSAKNRFSFQFQLRGKIPKWESLKKHGWTVKPCKIVVK